MSQRRSSKSHPSFYIDIEKHEEVKKERSHWGVIMVICLLVVGMVGMGAISKGVHVAKGVELATIVEDIKVEQRVVPVAPGIPAQVVLKEAAVQAGQIPDAKVTSPTPVKSEIIQVAGAAGIVQVIPPPALGNAQVSETSSHQPSPLTDLKEILSISPIIIISTPSPQQQQLENILMNLNITPQPTIVNLSKHPNYQSILSYLQQYESHSHTVETHTSPTGIIKLDLKEVAEDEDNIPRVFIGAVPVGNFHEIFELYNDSKLVNYLKERGKGKISIG